MTKPLTIPNTEARPFITYRDLMGTASKRASKLLKRNRKILAKFEALQAKRGYKLAMPSRLTWGEALSREMKAIYRENNVVVEITPAMAEHNLRFGEWREEAA